MNMQGSFTRQGMRWFACDASISFSLSFTSQPCKLIERHDTVTMPAPSQLAIATSALNRLVKEKASYHKEFEHQQANISKLEAEQATSEDENAEYTLRQEVRMICPDNSLQLALMSCEHWCKCQITINCTIHSKERTTGRSHAKRQDFIR
jgi:hypothetical protein